MQPSGQNLADSAGNPWGMVDLWWRGIPGEIWVVSETRIHGEIEGKFGEGFLMDSLEIP